MSSMALTAKDVAAAVERVAADTGFGYVHVIVAGGRIERIDRCVQIKAARADAEPSRQLALQGARERD
jgi:hypothetical protein